MESQLSNLCRNKTATFGQGVELKNASKMASKPLPDQARPRASYTESEDRSLFRRLMPRHLRWANRITRLSAHSAAIHTAQPARHYTTERGERIYLLVCFLLKTFLTNYDGSKITFPPTADPIVHELDKRFQELVTNIPGRESPALTVPPDQAQTDQHVPKEQQLRANKKESIQTQLRAKLKEEDEKSVVSMFIAEISPPGSPQSKSHAKKLIKLEPTETISKTKTDELALVSANPGLLTIADQTANASIATHLLPKQDQDSKKPKPDPTTTPEPATSKLAKDVPPILNDNVCANSMANLLSQTGHLFRDRTHFYRLLHELQPITNAEEYLCRFKGSSELLAIRHCKELESALKSWETSALRDLEQSKAALLNIRNLELLLLFAEEQQRALQNLFQRRARQICQMQREPSWETKKSSGSSFTFKTFFGIGASSPIAQSSLSSLDRSEEEAKRIAQNALFTEFQVAMRVKGQQVRCELGGALQLVQIVKQRAEQQVQVRSVYVRCIKELLRINVSNLMRLYTWSLRLRCSVMPSIEADKYTLGQSKSTII